MIIFAFLILLFILFYNDAKKELKTHIEKDVMTNYFITDEIVKFIKEHETYPKLRIIAFGTFARIFFPNHYEHRNRECFSFEFDKNMDIGYFEERRPPLNDEEIKIFTKALYEKISELYPEAKVTYNNYKIEIEFFEQKKQYVS